MLTDVPYADVPAYDARAQVKHTNKKGARVTADYITESIDANNRRM